MADSVTHNEGMIVKDEAEINVTQLIVGRNALGIVGQGSQSSIAELQSMLQQLIDTVYRERASLENADEITSSARLVADEALKNKPNRITITSVLNGMCSAAKSAASVATAAEAFKVAVMTLIG